MLSPGMLLEVAPDVAKTCYHFLHGSIFLQLFWFDILTNCPVTRAVHLGMKSKSLWLVIPQIQKKIRVNFKWKDRKAPAKPIWTRWWAVYSVHLQTALWKAQWCCWKILESGHPLPLGLTHSQNAGRSGSAPCTAGWSESGLFPHIWPSLKSQSAMGIDRTPSMLQALIAKQVAYDFPAISWCIDCQMCSPLPQQTLKGYCSFRN